MSTGRLHVVLCWHMHQPVYRVAGDDREPWTYLHAIKDYADMAAHLETVPGARAVVNFSPVLLEHVDALASELALAVAALDRGDVEAAVAALRDPVLRALLVVPDDVDARLALWRRCIQVHPRTMLARFPAYAQLARLIEPALQAPALLRYLSSACLADALVWFHIAWFGEHRRRVDVRLQRLQQQGGDFGADERQLLIRLIADEVGAVLPRYRALAGAGSVELCTSPWGHPILPLLLDLRAGREALPASPVPGDGVYPGGEVRAKWHIERAKAVFLRHFGTVPVGCWPSEGAVSRATVELLAASGFRWAASGGAVLRGAERAVPTACEHGSYTLDELPLRLFFRDDGLSDAIGFKYQGWSADAAVDELLGHLLQIRTLCPSPDAVVPIVLDGENAWEYYPENGYAFLQLLYAKLANHPLLQLMTFSEHIDHAPQAGLRLHALRAGSWVHGDLSTWVGNVARNRAWELLIDAKLAFDAARLDDAARAHCTELLAACECSDWFWWLSEHQNADALARFEQLYRAHLAELYAALGVAPPAALAVPLAIGNVHASAASMLPAE